jgi:hypothetical protein
MNPDKLSAGDWFFGKVLRMGANWQTTVSGVGAALFFGLTTLAGLSYQFGDIAAFMPPEVKKWVTIISLGATVALKAWNALVQKSKNVTGGSQAQTLTGDIAKPGTKTMVDMTRETSKESGEVVPGLPNPPVAAVEFPNG